MSLRRTSLLGNPTDSSSPASSTCTEDATDHDPINPLCICTQPNSPSRPDRSRIQKQAIEQSFSSSASSDRSLFEDAPDMDHVKRLMDDPGRATENLVESARKMLDYFKECRQSIPTWLTGYNIKQGKFKLDLVLTAMLDFAPMCGSPERAQSSLRYVAAAICACRGPRRESEETANALSALAVTWFAHFLWIFRMHSFFKKYSNEADPSGQATPTLMEPSGFMFDELGHCDSTMMTKVLTRQRYICPITGLGHRAHFSTHPSNDSDLAYADVENSHILKRAAAEFNLNNPKDSYRYAMTTWDIVRNYMALTDEEMEVIVPIIDDPSNGIGLEHYCRTSLDAFLFSLHATETPNEYTIQLHHPSFKFVFPWPPVGGREHRVIFKEQLGPTDTSAQSSLHSSSCCDSRNS
ncbi:uncharacterized protein BT62DRAFT_789088 [Guyanagaster necrorhizus]|uniref:HNH nuclease domain-containing protein n=1 Tax=Guyanagaster necrorhizus TaxID=856835 RepID=A0A9P8AU62_9AGAR|nr:uncharacterized protein BT62DRAFT_789088 [Guyanagaster necrorhizus MCA 3950]KAG7447696.1 hypothetical protein BT62DRAFT_789088 [Guyanagaster necrorhizus MCA 3950]